MKMRLVVGAVALMIGAALSVFATPARAFGSCAPGGGFGSICWFAAECDASCIVYDCNLENCDMVSANKYCIACHEF